ncbi:MAG: hypothetical protein LBD75_04785 [Candidatus Peribacteria bacterium]|jgi:hypothetical protein|nr:hypothetical protein [Candidatus Peribacteria bacterium]
MEKIKTLQTEKAQLENKLTQLYSTNPQSQKKVQLMDYIREKTTEIQDLEKAINTSWEMVMNILDIKNVDKETSNEKSQKLTEKKVTFSLSHTKQKSIEIDGNSYNVVKVHERPVVLVDLAGITVPFYMTTGLGGKDLPPGWYPFFGYGKD